MAQTLARAISLPGKSTPVRFPNFPALERTAVMGFNAPTNLTVRTGSTKVIVTRQAAFPLWAEQNTNPNSAVVPGTSWGLTYVTDTINSTGGATYAIDADITGTSIGSNYGTTQDSTFAPAFTNTVAPLSGYTISGIDTATGPSEWLWVPASAQIMLTVNLGAAATGNTNVVATFQHWKSPGEFDMLSGTWNQNFNVSFVAGQIAVGVRVANSATNAWYRICSISINDSAATPAPRQMFVNLSAAVTNSNPVFTVGGVGSWNVNQVAAAGQTALLPLVGPAEFANSALPWASTRVTSVGCNFSNVTKVLNKEGTVLWGRVNPRVDNIWTATSTTVTNLHPAEKAYLSLEQGTYTYVPPTTDLGFFADYRSNLIGYPVYRLDNEGFANVGFFSDPDGGTQLAINLDWHIEFRTSSTLFQIGVSTTPLEALHSAQIALLKSGFFFTNFDHVAIINKIISVLGSLHPLARVAEPFVRGIANSFLIANKTTTKQPTTSASGVGITRPRKSRASSRSRRAGPTSPETQRTAMRRALASMQNTRSKRTRSTKKRTTLPPAGFLP
jgi:hypothetical protein